MKIPSIREVAAKEHGLEDDERCECCEGGARAMAEAIRNALREAVKEYRRAEGYLGAEALENSANAIDEALNSNPKETK